MRSRGMVLRRQEARRQSRARQCYATERQRIAKIRFAKAQNHKRIIEVKKMERYMIQIRTDGTGRTGRLIRCDDGDTCKLETLQQLVGGLIETADSCLEPGWAREPVDSIKLIVNEEGLLQELPVNWKAMNLYQYGYMSGIVGTAVLAAARGDELIGFAKPVCETICAEWGIRLGGEEE